MTKIRLINWDNVKYSIDPLYLGYIESKSVLSPVFSKRPKAWELLLGFVWLNMLITTFILMLDYIILIGDTSVWWFVFITMILTYWYILGDFQENFTWWVRIPQLAYLLILMIWIFSRSQSWV